MKKSKMAKFVLMPAFAVSLIACGGKGPTVTELSVKATNTIYSVGNEIKNTDFTVTATYADKSSKVVADGLTFEPNLPYTFQAEDVKEGKDIVISYGDKKCSAHIKVVAAPAENEAQYTFKNYNGSTLNIINIEKGKQITYSGGLPKKASEGSEINYFMKWDKKLGIANENDVFTAQYQKIDKFIDNDNDGMPAGIDDNDNDNNFNNIDARSFVHIKQNIQIDFSKFLVDGANTNYDNELAKLGLFMSNPNIWFNDELFNNNDFGGENALYSRLGFDDFHHFDFKDEAAKTYTYDPKDTTSGVYGHKYLFDKNGNVSRDLIVIAFEGTNGKNRWYSNFDVGYDDEMYYSKTGGKAAHPEWTDTRFHKGFYVAAHRVLEEKVDGGTKEGPVKFLKYIEEHTTAGLDKPIVFVTGHSRGGAMANIVGEYLENQYKDSDGNAKCIPFTYAFAAPSVWGVNSTITAQTVFNVLNNDDFVAKVPFSGWDFSKLGDTTFVKSVGTNYKTLYDAENKERPYEFVPGNTIESIFNNVGTKGRKEIYNTNLMNESNAYRYISDTALNDVSFKTEEEANAEIKQLNKEYRDELGDFFNFVELKAIKETDWEGTECYNIYANACLGAITSLIQNLMINNEQVIGNIFDVLPLINNYLFREMAESLIIQIFPEGKDKIALPHDYGAYHILLREYKAS